MSDPFDAIPGKGQSGLKFNHAEDTIWISENMPAMHSVSAVNVMVGHKVALIRNTLGWSQETLAEKMGLSRASIANIEGGRQRVDLDGIELFCRIFSTTPHHFMKGIWWKDGRSKV